MKIIDETLATLELNALQKLHTPKRSSPNQITKEMVVAIVNAIRNGDLCYVDIAQRYRIRKEVVAMIHRKMRERVIALTPAEDLS